MKESEMKEIGKLISKAIDSHKNESELKKIREGVLELCRNFPVY